MLRQISRWVAAEVLRPQDLGPPSRSHSTENPSFVSRATKRRPLTVAMSSTSQTCRPSAIQGSGTGSSPGSWLRRMAPRIKTLHAVRALDVDFVDLERGRTRVAGDQRIGTGADDDGRGRIAAMQLEADREGDRRATVEEAQPADRARPDEVEALPRGESGAVGIAHVRRQCRADGTTATVQVACWTTLRLTDPSSSERTPPRPRDPTTTRSASLRASISTSAVRPSTT